MGYGVCLQRHRALREMVRDGNSSRNRLSTVTTRQFSSSASAAYKQSNTPQRTSEESCIARSNSSPKGKRTGQSFRNFEELLAFAFLNLTLTFGFGQHMTHLDWERVGGDDLMEPRGEGLGVRGKRSRASFESMNADAIWGMLEIVCRW